MASNNDNAAPDVICPHWSSVSRSCLLSKGGLFLPISAHINTYCLTVHHACCSQFIGSIAAGNEQGFDPGNADNRRRYVRIPGRFSFRLSESHCHDLLEALMDDSASTIDLSPGGIRFESYRSLPVDTFVTFSLNSSFSEQPLSGTGQVKWCASLENAPLFHAGIAFADDSISSAIRDRLGLAVS